MMRKFIGTKGEINFQKYIIESMKDFVQIKSFKTHSYPFKGIQQLIVFS